MMTDEDEPVVLISKWDVIESITNVLEHDEHDQTATESTSAYIDQDLQLPLSHIPKQHMHEDEQIAATSERRSERVKVINSPQSTCFDAFLTRTPFVGTAMQCLHHQTSVKSSMNQATGTKTTARSSDDLVAQMLSQNCHLPPPAAESCVHLLHHMV
jgi:hypothetical protein